MPNLGYKGIAIATLAVLAGAAVAHMVAGKPAGVGGAIAKGLGGAIALYGASKVL